MNIDPEMAAGYVMVAGGGFAIGAFAGRWMMTEMRSAMSAMQTRLSNLEQLVTGHSATVSSMAAPSANNSTAPAQSTAQVMHAAGVAMSAPAPIPAAPVVPAAPLASAAPTALTAATAQAAALEHHAIAVEKLAAAVDRHAQAVDDHGAATVAAAVELGSRPATITPVSTFAAPLHAAGVAMGASVAPVAAAAVAVAPQS